MTVLIVLAITAVAGGVGWVARLPPHPRADPVRMRHVMRSPHH
ncbi:hypothetical protein [Streptomyces sp. NPDC001340]